MGQKVNPILYRLSTKKHWRSSFYSPKPYSKSLNLDLKIRTYLTNLFATLSVETDLVIIKKYPLLSTIYISVKSFSNTTSIPTNQIIKQLNLLTGYEIIHLDISTLANDQIAKMMPLYNAESLSKYIISLIETRSKVGIKKVLAALKEVSNLKGYKIRIGGRINGVEMARHKIYKRGSLPLQSINRSVDYAYNTAYTKYGILGIKVWLYYVN
jgi:small subunit ribosomal protein S3